MTRPYSYIDERGSSGWHGCAWFIPNGHDSFKCAPWLIYTSLDSSILIYTWARQQRMTWLRMTCFSNGHDSLICAPWLIHMWHDSPMPKRTCARQRRMKGLRILISNGHDSLKCHDSLIRAMTYSKWTQLTDMRVMTHSYVTWLVRTHIQMCEAAAGEGAAHDWFQMDMIHSYASHDLSKRDMTRS